MNLLGHVAAGAVGDIKAVPSTVSTSVAAALAGVDNRGWYRILESNAGTWQRNVEVTLDNVTTHPAVFACATLIANDISKTRLRLVQQDSHGIWNEVTVPSFSPVLRKPNHYQNRIQFISSWLFSKLLFGNTYVLLVRDRRGVVTSMYVLDPQRVRPLVSPMGDVFYELKRDDLSLLPETSGYVVPASEICHDRWNTLFHPLVGLSPIYACGLAAVQGLNIQTNQTNFFGAGSLPGGVLTAPGIISPETAARLKAYFDENFSGENAGKVAVLGDGLDFKPLGVMSATDSQLIDQLNWSNAIVCGVFHVPGYKVGFGPMPTNNNIEALDQQYYSQGLQIHYESIELCLDEALGLTAGDVASLKYGTEFDLDDLLRMDSNTMMKTIESGTKAGVMSPDEGRKKLNLGPTPGGGGPYLQQQNYSLEALAKRDAQADPFASKTTSDPAPPAPPAPADDAAAGEDLPDDDAEKALDELLRKELLMAGAR